MTTIFNYPKQARGHASLEQAFRAAVLHAICYRAAEAGCKRKTNHAYDIGWWLGYVRGITFVQRRYTPNFLDNMRHDVIEECLRLEKLIADPEVQQLD